jgi:hypothetical protein
MASTYVNDLRLNEMATGDESGNWGVVTNLNLELIGEALGYGTEGITTNADTHTTTVADGATDPGRAMYIEYTGTLDSACTITIAPNTLNRMHFIENGTSGSQNIIISQGSGANITIPPGDTKAVYLDGAGSGAAVVDAFASLSVVDLKVQDDLTVTDDATIGGTLGVTGIVTLTDDLIIGDGKTIGSASDVDAMTIASNGQITLTQTLIGTALDISGDIDVDGTTNLDVVDIDGAVDMASTLQVDGAITSSAGATITVADNSENLVLKSTDADANVGPQLTLWRASGSPADNDAIGQISFNANDDGANVTNFATIAGFIDDASDGSEDGIIHINSMVAGTLVNRMSVLPAATVFNEGSVDVDFRVEGNGQANLFVVNAGSDDIGIGMATPTFSTGNGMQFADDFYLGFGTGNGTRPDFSIHGDNNGLGFACGTGSDDTDIAFDTSGNVGIGTTAPARSLHVNSGDANVASFEGHQGEGAVISSGTNGQIDIIGYDDGATAYNPLMIRAHTSGLLFDTSGNGLFAKTDTNLSSTGLHFSPVGGLNICRDDGNLMNLNRKSTDGSIMEFYKDGSSVGTISTNSNSLPSDRNYKKDIADLDLGLSLINKLKPSQYNYKIDDENSPVMYGLIAQDLEESLTEEGIEKNSTWLLQHKPNDDENKSDYSLDYLKLTPVLIKAIQEQQKLIESLTARITTLEG